MHRWSSFICKLLHVYSLPHETLIAPSVGNDLRRANNEAVQMMNHINYTVLKQKIWCSYL